MFSTVPRDTSSYCSLMQCDFLFIIYHNLLLTLKRLHTPANPKHIQKSPIIFSKPMLPSPIITRAAQVQTSGLDMFLTTVGLNKDIRYVACLWKDCVNDVPLAVPNVIISRHRNCRRFLSQLLKLKDAVAGNNTIQIYSSLTTQKIKYYSMVKFTVKTMARKSSTTVYKQKQMVLFDCI